MLMQSYQFGTLGKGIGMVSQILSHQYSIGLLQLQTFKNNESSNFGILYFQLVNQYLPQHMLIYRPLGQRLLLQEFKDDYDGNIGLSAMGFLQHALLLDEELGYLGVAV